MASVSKTAQVLKYFAQQYQQGARKGIPRLRLVKMAYMSDLLAREYLGHPVTNFAWIRYYLGPYDDAILDVIGELEDAKLAESREEWDNENETKRLIDKGVPISFDLTPGELECMRYVAENYLHMPMKELLDDVVYRSLPMARMIDRKPEERAALPMEIVDNVGTAAVGFELEAALVAEQEIASGQCATDF